jgi:hypothetical protein
VGVHWSQARSGVCTHWLRFKCIRRKRVERGADVWDKARTLCAAAGIGAYGCSLGHKRVGRECLEKGADRWAGRRSVGNGTNSKRGRMRPSVDSLRVRGCGRTRGPLADGRRITHNHCSQNTCLGADGCDIGREPQQERTGAGAGMEQAHAAVDRAHAATGMGGV